jgi:hypothetical protein
MERIGKFGHGVSYAFRWFLRLFWLALIGMAVWAFWAEQHRPPLSEADQARQAVAAKLREQQDEEAKQREQQKLETEKYLCRKAAACKKYDQVRLECATAGNFRTCLRIKMGENVSYIDVCSGYDEGAPAIGLDPKTPDVVRCFILNNF